MIFRPHAPPAYTGTRLSICGVLALGVMCFFVIYDGIAHRGTPSEPRVLQAHREQAYPLRHTGLEGVPAPDMTSPDVTFANADVSVPAQSQSIATIRKRQDGRAAYAQGFFSFAPFGGF